jgi:hypothetical protein
MHGGEEVSGGLVVTGGDRSVLLEFGEEVLDQMPRGVEMAIELPLLLTICLRRDHHLLSGGRQWLDHAFIGVVGLIGDQRIGLHVWQECIGASQIMGLATGQMKAGGIAERIDPCVDLGAQSAARAADRLVFAVFFWAPALC